MSKPSVDADIMAEFRLAHSEGCPLRTLARLLFIRTDEMANLLAQPQWQPEPEPTPSDEKPDPKPDPKPVTHDFTTCAVVELPTRLWDVIRDEYSEMDVSIAAVVTDLCAAALFSKTGEARKLAEKAARDLAAGAQQSRRRYYIDHRFDSDPLPF